MKSVEVKGNAKFFPQAVLYESPVGKMSLVLVFYFH
jgi:hypothetical protein